MLNATNNPTTPTSPDVKPEVLSGQNPSGSQPSDTSLSSTQSSTPSSDNHDSTDQHTQGNQHDSGDNHTDSDKNTDSDQHSSPDEHKPADTSAPSTFSPTLPPVILPSASGASHPPRIVDSVGDVHKDVTDTTERDSSFSTALATKVNAAGDHPKTGLTDSPFPAATISSSSVTMSTSTTKPSATAGDKPAKKGGFNLKVAAGAMMMFILVGGLGAGYYLQQQQQDTRNQAASEEVTDAEIVRTADEWAQFNAAWVAFLADPTNDWEDYVAFAENDGARYKCEEPIARVTEETLYGCDLNALFAVSDVEAYIVPEPISPQSSNLNAVMDLLITDSALLQEAGKRGDITLTEEIFNSTGKNTPLRYAALRQVRQLFSDTYEKTVDFEVLTIYFHNQVDPKIELEKAQTAAKSKMDNLYARLQSGEITFKQAGDEIKANKIKGDTSGVSLANLDPVYRENAYFDIRGHKFFSRIFRDDVFDDELRSLGEGQMSTVRLCRDYKYTTAEYEAAITAGEAFTPPFVDSCYVIFKVNAIKLGIEGESTETPAETVISQQYAQDAQRLIE